MLVADLLSSVERVAPADLALEWDNSGLQVGDASAGVHRILAVLELTEDVLDEVVSGGFDTLLTHHPLLFNGFRSLVEDRPKERALRTLVKNDISVVSCHTNLDASEGGIAEIVAGALGLRDTRPLEPAAAGWIKLVGFIPSDNVEAVAEAVFAAGAGGVGRYSDCAFSTEGTGWFTPGEGAHPTVGSVGSPERAEEVRWETVFPKKCAGAVMRAFVDAHPYEEPAFDVYAVDDILPRVGVGRIGALANTTSIERLAEEVGSRFEVEGVRWSGRPGCDVKVVGVLPGSGRGNLSTAVGKCDVLISGDFTYHDAELAESSGTALIDVSHGGLEWWAFKRWCKRLAGILAPEEVEITLSETWSDPWHWVRVREGDEEVR